MIEFHPKLGFQLQLPTQSREANKTTDKETMDVVTVSSSGEAGNTYSGET